METVNAIASAISNIFAWMTGRQNANNAADVKKGVQIKEEVNITDSTNNAIAKRDVKEIQNEIGE